MVAGRAARRLFAATSDLPRCPSCAALARPNVPMFNDVRWVDAVRREQQHRYEEWLASVREKRLVVIECGAGSAAASIRRVSDRLLERSAVTLVRINPVATEVPVVQAIGMIHESLPGLFGGADTAAVRSGPPVIDPITDPIQLRMEPVTCVDLGRGLVTPFDGRGISHDDASPFMDRYAEAQTRSANLPLAALDYPRVPWVARRPDVGTAQQAAALPYLAEFERVLVWSYLRFLAFVDATRKN